MMPSRIVELARHLLENVSTLDDYLNAQNLPTPSFDVHGPINVEIESSEVVDARDAAIDASTELSELLQGPIKCMLPQVR